MTKLENSAGAEAVPLVDDEDESSQIRRLPSLRGERSRRRRAQPEKAGVEPRDTQPCAPPAEARSEPFNLERTLRFARLVRETLPPNQDVARLLDLAILRRDAILLQSLMRHLYQLQQQEACAASNEATAPESEQRRTLLPPAPEHFVPPVDLGQLRRR